MDHEPAQHDAAADDAGPDTRARRRGREPAFPSPSGAWLTRFLVLRLLGFVYLFAFLSLALQVRPLIGHAGLLPADAFLERVAAHTGSRGQGFLALPGVFWLGISDRALVALAWLGVALAAIVLAGFANALLLLVLWALYMSFVHIGQDWYAYGWEIQLCETGFLAAFLCPLFDPRPFPRRPAPAAVIWLFRWLIFRIMLGAGLIKLRGDPCWRDLTCLDYHYETQPIPGPLSRAFHLMPAWAHKGGVLFNHVTELAAPWLMGLGRVLRRVAGALMMLFQLSLIVSGNLSFLNWLTIVPILACFDDALLARLLPRALVARAERAAAAAVPSRAQGLVTILLVAVVALLSIGPVQNLLSPGQRMNTSFDPLDLVNTYGAFGSVGKERYEIVFEGTDAETPDDDAPWREYELPAKPGDVHRRPPQIAPYQPRLDWALWFAAMSTPERYDWTLNLVWKLLHGDRDTLRLFANDPFPDHPPRWVRARLYRYRFAPPGSGAWWVRTPAGTWLRPLSADEPRFVAYLRARGWLTEERAARSGPR
jgi:Lipase maturation factor